MCPNHVLNFGVWGKGKKLKSSQMKDILCWVNSEIE